MEWSKIILGEVEASVLQGSSAGFRIQVVGPPEAQHSTQWVDLQVGQQKAAGKLKKSEPSLNLSLMARWQPSTWQGSCCTP